MNTTAGDLRQGSFLSFPARPRHFDCLHPQLPQRLGLPAPAQNRICWLLFFGILFFSGSLYALAISGVRILGAITPMQGGVAFIAAWVWLGVEFFRARVHAVILQLPWRRNPPAEHNESKSPGVCQIFWPLPPHPSVVLFRVRTLIQQHFSPALENRGKQWNCFF